MNRVTERISLNRIERRAIEALAIAPVIEMLFERIGKEEALVLLKEANQKEAFERGRHLMKSKNNNGIKELIEDVSTWGDGGVLEMEVLEETANTYFFNVHTCPYYEMYKELGLIELGVGFSCCRDEPFALGLNPRLKLKRSKTLMEGADFCDFRYFLESE